MARRSDGAAAPHLRPGSTGCSPALRALLRVPATRCPAKAGHRVVRVELEGFEPSSVECEERVLRPFPRSRPVATSGPGAHVATSSPWCSRLSDRRLVSPSCPPPLLLPGCGGQTLRAIAGRCVTSKRLLARARRRVRGQSRGWRLCVVPRLTSLSSSGRTHRLTVSTSKPVSPLSRCPSEDGPAVPSVPVQSPRRAAASVRSISRSASRLATAWRLSWSRRPRTRASSSFALPSRK